MALQIKRTGFGQVEPNHLSAQQTGQIYAQLPADSSFNILENGMFLKYDYPAGKCDLTGEGEWLLVFNEVKLYDERKFNYKDFAMKKTDYMDGELVPRLLRVEVGDIFTTNTFGANTSDSVLVAGETLTVGNHVIVDSSTGYLTKSTAATPQDIAAEPAPVFVVVKEYNLGDMQPAVKLQRIK